MNVSETTLVKIIKELGGIKKSLDQVLALIEQEVAYAEAQMDKEARDERAEVRDSSPE